MNLFERIPTELFSVLASPNRALYADALDVLWEAYRDNLKIPEHVLYSMLRSKLEQQLADATFEGEDIDEEELRDISGRARFLIRKLYSKGWFEKERSEDFDEYITVPGYSSSLLKLFHQLRDDSPIRGYSYVFSTYSTLKVADESGSIYDKMAAVYNAYDNTQALLQLLQMVYHNVKHFFQLQMKMQEVNDVLASHFDDFGQKVVEAYIRPLKIKDSVPKYRVPIQTILTNWAEDDALLAALANAALQDRRGTALAECRRDLLQKIFEVKDCYDSIESEYFVSSRHDLLPPSLDTHLISLFYHQVSTVRQRHNIWQLVRGCTDNCLQSHFPQETDAFYNAVTVHFVECFVKHHQPNSVTGQSRRIVYLV